MRLLMVIGLILLTACAQAPEAPPEAPEPPEMPEPIIEEPEQPTVVATLNGENIYQEQVDQLIQDVAQQTGQQINESSALEGIVLNRLLMREAERLNTTASAAEIEAMLEEELALQNSTLADFKEMVGEDYSTFLEKHRQRLSIERLSESLGNFTVTEEEARGFFVQYSQGNQTYEDYSEEIKQALRAQKQQQALMALANELLQNATLEIQ